MKPKTHLIFNIILGLVLLAVGINFVRQGQIAHSLLDFVIAGMNISMGLRNWKLMGCKW